jgi:hypothetical protein
MRINEHLAKSIEVDFPPGSGEVVGRVDVKKLASISNYRHVVGYLGNRLIFSRNMSGGLPFRSLEKRLDSTVTRAERQVRYAAKLALDIPTASDLQS